MATAFLDLFGRYLTMPESMAAALGDIQSLTLEREKRSLVVCVELHDVLERQEIRFLERRIGDALELDAVTFLPRYPGKLFNEAYLPQLIAQLREQSLPVNGFFEGAECRLEETLLSIDLKNGGLELLEQHNVSAKIARIIKDEFELEVTVLLNGDGRAAEKNDVFLKLRQMEQETMVITPKDLQEKEFSFNAEGLDFIENSMLMLFGKPMRGKPEPIANINENAGKVLLWGDLFQKIDIKETRDGKKKICTFAVTDYTSSINLKLISEIQRKTKDPLCLNRAFR